MSQADYEQLITEAVAEVESGGQRPCGTTERCCEMGGCPRCFRGFMSGVIGIKHIEVLTHGGVISHHNGRPRGPTLCRQLLWRACHHQGEAWHSLRLTDAQAIRRTQSC
jgi:hypothetical protein